jgi:hypothetical protein
MITKTLGHSRKYAAVRQQAGRLGEFAQLLYPLLVANADAMGRQAGDTFTVKHAVLPTSPRKEADFAAALSAMAAVNLIQWYDVDGQQVISVVGFDVHQDLHKEAKKSIFPEFSGNARNLPENSPLIKLNSIQSNSTHRVPADAGTAEADESKKLENRHINAFLRRFCDLYALHRHGARYFVTAEKHVPLVRKLLSVYGSERLEKLALVLLKTDDEWVQGTDRGIGILSIKASWLDERLAAYEAQHGPAKVAS